MQGMGSKSRLVYLTLEETKGEKGGRKAMILRVGCSFCNDIVDFADKSISHITTQHGIKYLYVPSIIVKVNHPTPEFHTTPALSTMSTKKI
jgi:hypothetical protein